MRARLPALAAAALLAACAGNALTPDAPAGVSLAGAWKLNRAASDDPQKILERMREQALRIMSRRPVAAARPAQRGGARGAPPDEPVDIGEAAPPAARDAPRLDPLLRSPMARLLRARVARGDFLAVRQAPGELTLDYGNSQRSFTPGARSVVSVEGGVADQISGWKGREYVVEQRGQQAPNVTERYRLGADGQHLIETLHIGSAELPAVDLRRVYDPATEATPRQPPTSD